MNKKEELESKAKQAIWEKAIFRWENAAVISMTMLLSVFDGLFDLIPYIPWWAWTIGGTLGAGALIYSTLTDPNIAATAVAEMLREDFRPERLKDKKLQQRIYEALSYHARLNQVIQERGQDSMIGDELQQVADKMDEWIEEIYGLAQRLDRYRRENQVFGRNRQRALVKLKEMEQRLNMEANPRVREDLQANIEALRYQIKTLEEIEDTMQRAELMLDNKLTAMGTIYLQSTLAGAKEIDSSRAKRLRQEISDEVVEMDDILVTMDEIYASSGEF